MELVPNGVKIRWNIEFNVSTGLESDCRGLVVNLCRRRTAKPWENILQCEAGEVIQTFSVDSCKFRVEYNHTMNETISGNFQMYLQFRPSDLLYIHNLQLFLLPTKGQSISF